MTLDNKDILDKLDQLESVISDLRTSIGSYRDTQNITGFDDVDNLSYDNTEKHIEEIKPKTKVKVIIRDSSNDDSEKSSWLNKILSAFSLK